MFKNTICAVVLCVAFTVALTGCVGPTIIVAPHAVVTMDTSRAKATDVSRIEKVEWVDATGLN